MPSRSASRVCVAGCFAAVTIIACAGPWSGARRADRGALRNVGVGAAVDPTVRPARLLPMAIEDTHAYGIEPGGGARAIVGGLRLVMTKDGGTLAAAERLPQAPHATVALPERLGGGFLFVLGTTVWRAERWLDRATPIFTSPHTIQAVIPGLDRVYVRAQNGYVAIDGAAGRVVDLGPFPASPFVSAFAAADGWRAIALTDLRGAVATFDAGATWRTLEIPLDARHVLVSGDSLVVGGLEEGRTESWMEVRPDGAVSRLATPPPEAKGKPLATPPSRPFLPGAHSGRIQVRVAPSTGIRAHGPNVPWNAPPAATPSSGPNTPDGVASAAEPDSYVHLTMKKIFGRHPIVAAIEDGWPLRDGTAVVARDGALARVRLSDGGLEELAEDAFALKPARCHALSLTRASSAGAFGFVCGDPHGPTVIYAYDMSRGRLRELRQFDSPRVVTSSGNGAIAVRGRCAADADAAMRAREPMRLLAKGDAGAHEALPTPPKSAASEVEPFCVYGHDDVWREILVRGDTGDERIVVLSDGRVVVVSPPRGPTEGARLTLVKDGRAATLPVLFPKVAADVERVLRLGVWLDGFEERRPGVVGGFIEASGTMLGIEITTDGQGAVGQFVRDAGLPFVAGRYGLGFTSSRRAFETTDGGMTWRSFDVPEPLVPITKVERRACGPIGCIAGGWLRVGWGEPKAPPPPVPPPPYRPSSSATAPQLTLSCEPRTPMMPAPKPTSSGKPVVPKPASRAPGTTPMGALSTMFGATSSVAPLAFPGFFADAAPAVRDSERALSFEVRELPERYPNLGALARIYAWGPSSGDWDTQGRWQIKWLSPFAPWPEAKSSLPVLPPQAIVDLTRGSSPFTYGGFATGIASGLFQIATGDDPSHALLLVRTLTRTSVTPIALESDRAPLEVRRADGEPFADVDAVVRAGGFWFIATSGGVSTPSVTTIWQVEGGIARELVRIPRLPVESGRPSGTKLARRSDGRAIGLVVDGQGNGERSQSTRWVLPVDLDTARVSEPEPLGYIDLGGRSLDPCADDSAGWTFDTSLPATAVHIRLPHGGGSLHSTYARLRITSARTCVDQVAGTFDGDAPARSNGQHLEDARRRSGPRARPGELEVTVFARQSRYGLRCTVGQVN